MPIPSADVIDKAAARTLLWDGCVNVRELGGIPTEAAGIERRQLERLRERLR